MSKAAAGKRKAEREAAAQPGRCQWGSKRCQSWATVLYRSGPSKFLLCDSHWDGLRTSLTQTFGDWERVCEVVEFGSQKNGKG